MSKKMQWLGRQKKCNSDIVSNVGIITYGVTNGFGQAKKRGVHGEKYVGKICRFICTS